MRSIKMQAVTSSDDDSVENGHRRRKAAKKRPQVWGNLGWELPRHGPGVLNMVPKNGAMKFFSRMPHRHLQ